MGDQWLGVGEGLVFPDAGQGSKSGGAGAARAGPNPFEPAGAPPSSIQPAATPSVRQPAVPAQDSPDE